MFAQHAIACVLCELLLELFLVFFQTLKRFLTSFSILFNFQGPVAPQPCGWRPVYCTTEVVFCQALFFRSFWTFWTWTSKKFLRTNRELVGVSPLHLAFARPLCLLERPTGAIHCFRNRKTFQRLLVLFKGFLLRLRKSFFCLSAWRSSIIPHPRLLVNTFWQIFSILFCARPETASDREVYAPQLLWCSLAQMPFLFAYIMYYKAFAV